MIINLLLFKNDVFSQLPKLSVILSAKLYNIAIDDNKTGDKSKNFQKIAHRVPMLSLANAFGREDLVNFEKKILNFFFNYNNKKTNHFGLK